MKRFVPLTLVLLAVGCGTDHHYSPDDDARARQAYVSDPSHHCKVERDFERWAWDASLRQLGRLQFTGWTCENDLWVNIDYVNGKPWRP